MLSDGSSLVPGARYNENQPYSVTAAYFDVDNTLLPNNGQGLPSERFIRAANAARGTIKLALATARGLRKAGPLIDHMGADGLSILNNGAQIYDGESKTVVAEWPLNVDTALGILDKLHETGAEYWVNDDGTDYFPTNGTNGKEQAGKVGYATQVDIWDTNKGLVPVPDYKPTKPFVIVVHDVTEDRINDIHTITNDCGDPNVESIVAHESARPDGTFVYDMFILNKQANKKNALEVAMAMQGLSVNEVMAVGDGRNDAVLVGSAGVGVAMGNSAAETLNVATFIAPDINNDGAAAALEHFL